MLSQRSESRFRADVRGECDGSGSKPTRPRASSERKRGSSRLGLCSFLQARPSIAYRPCPCRSRAPSPSARRGGAVFREHQQLEIVPRTVSRRQALAVRDAAHPAASTVRPSPNDDTGKGDPLLRMTAVEVVDQDVYRSNVGKFRIRADVDGKTAGDIENRPDGRGAGRPVVVVHAVGNHDRDSGPHRRTSTRQPGGSGGGFFASSARVRLY